MIWNPGADLVEDKRNPGDHWPSLPNIVNEPPGPNERPCLKNKGTSEADVQPPHACTYTYACHT